MIRVQNQRHVERARGERRRPAARQHVQKIRCVAKSGVWIDGPATGPQPSPSRDERAHLAGEPHGLPVICLRRVVRGLGIAVRQNRRQGAKSLHTVDARQRTHRANDAVRQYSRCGERGLEVTKLGAARQPSVPEEVADLLEGHAALGVRQVVNVVALVREDAAVAIQVTDGGGTDDDVL